MRFIQFIFSTLLLSFATNSLAATLSASSNITFLAFDGQKVKSNKTLPIEENKQHQAVVAIECIIHSGSDERYFESSPIVISFTGSHEDIKLVAPNIQNEMDAEKFNRTPQLNLKTVSGKSVSHKLDIMKSEGFMPKANLLTTLMEYNNTDAPAAVAKLGVNPPINMLANDIKTKKGKVVVQGENIAEQQLQFWFQQSDKETRKRFLDWAKQQH